jgi:hypothetical protein
MYADDLLLLSSSVVELQCMLDTCSEVGSQLSILFNNSKSKCLAIGPNNVDNLASLTLNGNTLQWVDKLKYLGVWICADKYFNIDLSETRRKFFQSVNSILSKCKHTNELVKLQLLENHCLPILLYATECIHLKLSQIKEINSWWNSVYRKIFNYNKWESVKCLICSLQRLDVHHLINLRCLSFIKRMLITPLSNNSFKNILNDYIHNGNFVSIVNKYNCQFSWTISKIKSMLHLSFENLNSVLDINRAQGAPLAIV